jgi:hypothetical protein
MSDLEQRLTDALTEGAQGAPSAAGLAAAARSRARARRRNRLVGAAAVVALAIAVPTAVWATHDSDPDRRNPSRVANDPDAVGQDIRGGYHYESWHDVTIEVPNTWVHGPLNQWCVDDGQPDEPRVDRPGGAQTLVLCSPATGYGVRFQTIDNTDDFQWPLVRQSGDTWPADAYVGARGLGGVLVEVALPDLVLAQQILDSAQHNDRLDPHGCPVDAGTDPVVPGDTMTVCRYDEAGLLEQSELLSGADLEAAELALEAAPDAAPPECAPDPTSGESIRMASVAEDAVLDLHSCASLTVHGESRMVTPDVLYWALSPGWSGTVPGDVSLPSELR